LFTRRDARIDLSRQGAEALNIISQLLDSGNYRIQLGALIALSEMPDNQRKRAPPALVDKARVLLNHNDAAMREAAARAIR
jgi:hypothetical protein